MKNTARIETAEDDKPKLDVAPPAVHKDLTPAELALVSLRHMTIEEVPSDQYIARLRAARAELAHEKALRIAKIFKEIHKSRHR